ncbi:MAG: translation elongation factor Ts [Candidatus Komeilibacteria bacterium RIFOXYC1_FULL_37_11]|uniref:Elongation factor Ts n=1 Tax=Candidatus Komeilibacteria bacterium RIFOXYC1_FULL_37_11 TaxID=1798555 RepID=A0A1G2C032_9BACT|nr:MAG: translation elongation factor Ts [Candidatus Komeilibacteria bacterium RIFOXYC1_FULL_37_11]OGY95809.1 MAG: translation elongation factor Ts [Candidatus Komeilibacteria bacterium RIFOXYD1_FULL_37_29]
MSLELIKEIRQITGAGISDVKEALDEAAGAKDKAIEILRKKGQKIAAKKSEREVKEGVIAFAKSGHKVAVVALACETDFVAKNEDFKKAVAALAEKLLSLGQDNFQAWATKYIQDELIVKIGENLRLTNFDIFEGATVGTYLHSNNKVAAAAVLKGGSEDLANAISMHIAAMAPKYLRPEDVPVEVVDKEKEIYAEQLSKEGKPQEVLAKIMEGKVNKFYTEVCLLKQLYIKDDKKSIEKLLAENKANIENFVYYSL